MCCQFGQLFKFTLYMKPINITNKHEPITMNAVNTGPVINGTEHHHEHRQHVINVTNEWRGNVK